MPIDYNKRPSKGGDTPAPAAPPAAAGPVDYSKRPAKGGDTPATAPAAAGGAAGPVSLTKRGQQVSLTKRGGGGPVRINLNWDQGQAAGGGGGGKGGFLKRMAAAAGASGGIDLDLGCLVEMADGSKGVVQALGNSFGSLDGPPYIKLDKDDRSGTSTDGENLFVSEKHSADIKRIAVFAFIYQGAQNWSKANARVTIHPPSGETVTIALDETRDGVGMCGICLIHGGSNGFTVQREVQYVSDHRKLDELYGWGMQWTRGSK